MSQSSSVPTVANPSPRRVASFALWGLQGLLALAFLAAGAIKVSQPLDHLVASGMTFVEYTPAAVVRFIGVAEVLGAIGLIAPAATRLYPWLTGVAAAALGVVMALAVGAHATHGEPFVVPVVLGVLCAFVAWGRLVLAPIRPRETA
jgi:putative oxidoreductase